MVKSLDMIGYDGRSLKGLLRGMLCLGLMMWSMGVMGQSKWAAFKKEAPALRWWALTHPFVVGKAYEIAKYALYVTDSIAPHLDNDHVGGKADAFRHTYWMALTAQAIGRRRALSLGKAHEKADYQNFQRGKLEDGEIQDAAASKMDLKNNNVGIAMGCLYPNADRRVMRDHVLKAIETEQLYYIWKDKRGHSLDSAGQVIREEDWRGVWDNGRVVVQGGIRGKR